MACYTESSEKSFMETVLKRVHTRFKNILSRGLDEPSVRHRLSPPHLVRQVGLATKTCNLNPNKIKHNLMMQ